VRGLHACARDALGLIERAETREAVLRALLRFSGSRVDTGDLSPEQAEDTALLEKLEKQAIKAICDDPSFAPDFLNNQVLRNAPDAIKPLLEDALDVIDSDDPGTWQRRFVRVLQPQRLAARMMVRKQDIEQVIGNLEGLIQSASGYDHLTSFFRAMNEREMRQHGMPKKHALLISSIEAAKGLEFDHVILPGLNKGEFALGGQSVDNRNLLYVAMTRARRRLTILCDAGRPSAYLRDAGLL
jgi:DNA helicase-2/ATP-dependent DNA helicase PcrA